MLFVSLEREMWEYENRLLWQLQLMIKMPRFLIYRAAVKEYFSENVNLDRARSIIQQWVKYVK